MVWRGRWPFGPWPMSYKVHYVHHVCQHMKSEYFPNLRTMTPRAVVSMVNALNDEHEMEKRWLVSIYQTPPHPAFSSTDWSESRWRPTRFNLLKVSTWKVVGGTSWEQVCCHIDGLAGESWNLIISIIQCACWYVDPGKGSEESLLISWKKWSVICVEKISSVWGKCTLLHLKESGHGPQILVNSLKLCLQGCIPENRQDWG